MKKILCLVAIFVIATQPLFAGLTIVKGSGITLTGADGISYVGASGITLTGADGVVTQRSNGITLTGADGITLTGADGITLTGADGASYTGPNGITLTGADGITLTGADGITLTGADGATYTADSFLISRPDGITLTGADGITLTGADGITLTGADGVQRAGANGITLTGADGITLTGADGITLTGADGITLTGADGVKGVRADGVVFNVAELSGITLTGADGITLTGADGITLTGADGITLTGADGITLTGADSNNGGLQSVDPELAAVINNSTDDSNINAVVVFHDSLTDGDIDSLRQIGVLGGTRFHVLPAVYVSATRSQLLAVSRLPRVRSIYGNRTVNFNSDPHFNITGLQRVSTDPDLREQSGLPFTGNGVTVAVLDTGLDRRHPDLSGRVVQNVSLVDLQSAPVGFTKPTALEDQQNTDMGSGHGTVVGGIIAGSGGASAGKFAGVAPGASILGLSAGNANLLFVLSGLDYVLQHGGRYGVRVVNCSFSAATVYDPHDPVNVATKMLTDRGVNVVFSAGNSGSGNGTMNPYARAPWVISVGATDEKGVLAGFSSRGSFGDGSQNPTVVAPGVDVVGPRALTGVSGSSRLGGADLRRLSASEIPYYTTASGTSFSAPQVAGAIALMLDANPNLSPSEVKEILARTATPLPKYFVHEAGAGMLNSHAAVLSAAFPERRIGLFRSVLSGNGVAFQTYVAQTFEKDVIPGTAATADLGLPENTVQATLHAAWSGIGNDLGVKVHNNSGTLLGESNMLNLPGLTGLREKVVLRAPSAGTVRASVRHTGGVGTVQRVYGSLEVTRVEFPRLIDQSTIPAALQSYAERSMMSNMVLLEGRRFKPLFGVHRYEFAGALVRGGMVPQYVAARPMYTDVRDPYTRNIVESVQAAGGYIADAPVGGRFEPYGYTTRLIAAIAFVRAAGLESATSTSALPLTITDAGSIPAAWRGHVAVALQRGFLSLQNGRFEPSRSLTRIELAESLVKLVDNR